jgi:hypothetical protein
MNTSKIKFKDIVADSNVLKAEELSVLEGGIAGLKNDMISELTDGCQTGICVNVRDLGSDKYCDGSATCTSGIGVCSERT